MLKTIKKKTSRVMAFVMAVVMITTIIPFGTFINVLAATVDTYTITLTDGTSVINLDGVSITLTNKTDSSKKSKENTVNGVATFEDFVEEGETYIVSISEKTGYESIPDFDISPTDGTTNKDVTFTAIEKVELKGTVKDENGEPYKGATVKVTGYISDITVTGADGTYSFTAYKGKNYTVTATAKEDKYETATTTISSLSSTQPSSVLQFLIKEFSITTNSDSNGTVTSPSTNQYGESMDVTATANDGYCIDAFKIDGVEQTDATAKKEYTYSFTNIKASHSVVVTFRRQTYKISFTVAENGKVEYTDGTKQTVAGGSVNIDKEFNESEDPSNPTKVTVTAIPRQDEDFKYRVSKIIKDGEETTYNENDKEVTEEFLMTKDHTFEVEFSLNQYAIRVSDNIENGTVTVGSEDAAHSSQTTVKHGEDAYILAIPDEGYDIGEIKIGSTTLTPQESINGYEAIASKISGDATVTVSFVEKQSASANGYTLTLPEKHKIIGGITYVANGATVKIEPTSGYKRVKVNGDISYITNSVNVGNGYFEIEKIFQIELSTNSIVGGWSKPISMNITYDETKPSISDVTNDNVWNSSKTDYTFSVSDTKSGIKEVKYSATGDVDSATVISPVNGKYNFSVDEEFNGEYTIWAVDYCGNTTTKNVKVKIDKTAPVVDSINKEPNREWTKENTTIKGNVSDSNSSNSNLVSNVNRVVYTTNASLTNNEIIALGADNTATLSNGKYSFNLSDSQNTIYYVYAVDNAGNVSEPKSISVKITRVLPIVNSVEKVPSKEWHNDDVKVIVNASIETGASPINRVVYTTSNNLNTTQILGLSTVAHLEDGKYVFTVDKSTEQNAEYYVYAIDDADNVSAPKTITIKIDTTIPTVDSYIFKKLNSSASAKILHFLTFGLFFNEEIEVTATVSDGNETDDSQCNKVVFQMYSDTALGDKYGEPVEVLIEDNSASTTIPINFKGVIKTVAYDNAGNASLETMASNNNSNLGVDGFIMTEAVASNIVFKETTPKSNSKNWYNSKDITIPFDVTDETNGDVNSGIYSIEVKAFYNQSKEEYQTVSFNDGLGIDNAAINAEKTRHIDLTFGTDTDDIISYKGDGKYTIVVSVSDNCGNISTEEFTFFVDTTAARVVSFELGKESEGVVEETDYGYYFKNDVDVIVTVDDTVEGVKDISQACEVRYYTVDYSEPEHPVYSGSTTENYSVAEFDSSNNQAIIPIRGNFKGQIYAWVIDNAGNTSIKSYNGDNIPPVKPDGSILESEAKHESEEHIKFDKKATTFTAEDGTELYAKSVPVTITVIDTYSGIREIEWSVEAPYDKEKNQSGKVTVNNDKSFADDSEEGWNKTKTENNLVTEMQKQITVDNNSNNIKVIVKMTDRAGNTSKEEIEFGIDTTKPTIEVTYDNNTPDATYKDIYKANRTATVKITERNFNAKDVIYKITNTDKVIPELSDWEAHYNKENPDETYFTATIKYVEDGDYTFDISYSDRVKNPADKFKQHTFTIDKTVPTFSITYDNEEASKDGNGYRYFNKDRIATITINEHNFDASRVNVIGTATDNGTKIAFPAQLNADADWTDTGDTHTAHITYSVDAKYTFDIEFLDKAGNPTKDVDVDEFCIDKTEPTLEITGVEDKSANNGTVAPIVTCTDTNFNKDAVKIELIGVKNSQVEYESSTKNIDNGQEVTYKDFEKIKKVDDIYTLQATLTDYAGNETSKAITFSANRFGSVYTFERYLLEIEGKYTNVKEDIVFTETNVDTLEKGSVQLKLFKNGTPTDLKEGTDYDIKPSGGNGKWSQYQYTVHKDLIDSDGKYRLTVYSKDVAGNINENIDEAKSAEISFGIDTTKPVITPIDLEKGAQYAEEEKTVKAEIKDNLVLDKVTIYYGNTIKPGNEITYTVDDEIYTFSIPQKNEKQTILFVATDAAGNTQEYVVEDFLVTTNWFVRWYNNTPLFIGTIAGAVLIAVGVSAFIIFGKKRKKDNDDDNKTF